MSYFHLRQVIEGCVRDGFVTLIVRIDAVSDEHPFVVIVQDAAHHILKRLDDSPRLIEGTTVMLSNVLVQSIPATEHYPSGIAIMATSSTSVTMCPCTVAEGPGVTDFILHEALMTRLRDQTAPRTQPATPQRPSRDVCDWCTDVSTPFCSGTGRPHDYKCSSCNMSRKSSPFCLQTGAHH